MTTYCCNITQSIEVLLMEYDTFKIYSFIGQYIFEIIIICVYYNHEKYLPEINVNDFGAGGT